MLNAKSHCATETYRPRSAEDTVDAGVHHIVAAMRMGHSATLAGRKHIVDGIDLKAEPWMKRAGEETKGYTYMRKNGLISSLGTCTIAEVDPTKQIARISEMGGVDPSNYFKSATKSGINPLEDVLKSAKAGPGMPTRGDAAKDKKDKKKKDKKKEKKKKEKKKGKKKKDKKKEKKKKDKKSSSSSASEDKKKDKKRKKSSSSSAAEDKKKDKKRKQSSSPSASGSGSSSS